MVALVVIKHLQQLPVLLLQLLLVPVAPQVMLEEHQPGPVGRQVVLGHYLLEAEQRQEPEHIQLVARAAR